jgi:hypothetical protein
MVFYYLTYSFINTVQFSIVILSMVPFFSTHPPHRRHKNCNVVDLITPRMSFILVQVENLIFHCTGLGNLTHSFSTTLKISITLFKCGVFPTSQYYALRRKHTMLSKLN